MNPSFSLSCLLLQGLFCLLATLPAAASNELVLKIKYANHGRLAEVVVPPGVKEVTLQLKTERKGWLDFITRKTTTGKTAFTLPDVKEFRWRVVAQPARKFPAKFYQGKNDFAGVKVSSGYYPFAKLADITGTPGMEGQPAVEEADIWKIDGSTVYYFNQLRGLQILDLTNPADPRLTASLRLPAIGQDLYLVPGSGAIRQLLLLTSIQSPNGSESTRIHQVTINGGSARITHTCEVGGRLADSRLVGKRLVLATTRQVRTGKERWADESRISEWLISLGRAPQPGMESIIPGSDPMIASGSDWLAVATHGDRTGSWTGFSQVTVFALRADGIVRLTRNPVRTAGMIADSFKIQWRGNVLTTISESNRSDSNWEPITVLENFRVWGPDVILPAVIREVEHPRLGRLELAKGESLFATRFSGKIAYIVTFLQTDPLWVVDLSDPAKPAVAGHLEVPGWSSHLEPIGDLLFSIGWESGQVAASLFDVADPAKPLLLRRLALGSQSEATWDEKALKILPETGLAMIPMTTSNSNGSRGVAGIRLLDLDLAARDLRLRGFIPHAFDPRRAAMLGEAVVSISQRGLVTADIADRDRPAVLAEVALAWPVERVLDAGKFLIQIEDGSSYGDGRATARVTPANATEQVLTEIDLGNGTVRFADLRHGRLVILRETGGGDVYGLGGGMIQEFKRKLRLDVYEASSLPALNLLGSAVKSIGAGQSLSGNEILWPTKNLACFLLADGGWPWMPWVTADFIQSPITTRATKPGGDTLQSTFVRGWLIRQRTKAPQILTVDLSRPGLPQFGESVRLGSADTSLTGVSAAKDGLLVVGTSDFSQRKLGQAGETFFHARVVSFSTEGAPQPRFGIDLPGSLVGVTELNRDGFLAFTQSGFPTADMVQASACDGYDAFLIDQIATRRFAPLAVSGRRLFIGGKTSVASYRLEESGEFVARNPMKFGWSPAFLRCVDGVLLATDWSRLFATDVSGAAADQWKFPGWSLRPEFITIAADGDLLVPFGDYGAERLDR
ncbi:MAG: beta-propeller domain-containing protein [Akkermansiaceae bacterium]